MRARHANPTAVTYRLSDERGVCIRASTLNEG